MFPRRGHKCVSNQPILILPNGTQYEQDWAAMDIAEQISALGTRVDLRKCNVSHM